MFDVNPPRFLMMPGLSPALYHQIKPNLPLHTTFSFSHCRDVIIAPHLAPRRTLVPSLFPSLPPAVLPSSMLAAVLRRSVGPRSTFCPEPFVPYRFHICQLAVADT